MAEPKTYTLDAPGAVLHYDVRSPSRASTEPVLLIIGSPMGADGFTTLAGHFADRTVVTYDPRSAGRSKRTDGASETTPDEHADDLHRLISALDAALLSHNIITCNASRHDFDALRKAPTRIVIGVGAKSGQQLAGRAGAAVAGRLGIAPVTFPGDHGGFLGGEYGQTGEPDAFAATLREGLTA